ncbi:TlpA family protein disulfide reductase [Sediminibacterium roseum]|uniref:TlpA family protein disulfide reductase n=1 Tax=Sediminibacterium roseum TaxID=1978412 RepID=A0ABW9ZT60_9BACT|nr:TlpA disulfide reductase family protein [Sediminibacterium roseum]NCI50305.1 TlpA family protein disulfide reductase [Sediminibacterium roseum]
MKRLLLLLMTATAFNAQSQQTDSADKLLRATLSRLQSLTTLSYNQVRETMYYGENYHNVFESSLYFDFTKKEAMTGFRFQASTADRNFIFDGSRAFNINKEKLTIDSISIRTIKGIENNSFLYHSVAMIRNAIPLVLANDSIMRFAGDTLINGRYYDHITLNCPERLYFQIFNGVLYMDKAGSRMQYHLITDKKTHLPYMFVQKYIRSAVDDRDFVKTIYSNMNEQPDAPASSSWAYASYSERYKPYVAPTRKAVVKPGDTLADFNLPSLTAKGKSMINYSSFKGKVVLLDFWFRTCGPCIQAMPKYNLLQASFINEGFRLVTVNIQDTEEEVRFFYNKFQPNYTMLIQGEKLFDKLGFTGCPSAVLVDTHGKVVKTYIGFNEAEMSKDIRALLN